MGFWKDLTDVLSYTGATIVHLTQEMAIAAAAMAKESRNDLIKNHLKADPNFLTHQESVDLVNLYLQLTDSRTLKSERVELANHINFYVNLAKTRLDDARATEALALCAELGIQVHSSEEALEVVKIWSRLNKEGNQDALGRTQ